MSEAYRKPCVTPRRRRHEASGPGPENIASPDPKLRLAGEHIERVDVVVVGMRVNAIERRAEAELHDFELWKLPEDPVMSFPRMTRSPLSGPSATMPSTDTSRAYPTARSVAFERGADGCAATAGGVHEQHAFERLRPHARPGELQRADTVEIQERFRIRSGRPHLPKSPIASRRARPLGHVANHDPHVSEPWRPHRFACRARRAEREAGEGRQEREARPHCAPDTFKRNAARGPFTTTYTRIGGRAAQHSSWG